MKRTNYQIREAFKTASLDMKPELKKIREERPNEPWIDWNSYTSGVDVWNVSMSDLANPDTTQLNRELGLNSVDGINQWYNL